MYNSGYPTTNFTWNDRSGASTDTLFAAAEEGLNVPFSFVMAERGEPGAIHFGGGAEISKILGPSTFDASSPYFNAATQFIGTAMAGQGVEVMRLVDPDAKTANMGLFLSVTETDVVQYQKDPSGARVVDGRGAFIPLLKTDRVTPVTERGVELTWISRELADNEDFEYLATKSVIVDENTTTKIYPIIGFQVTSPGKYGNRQGFMFYSTGTRQSSLSVALDSVLYRFVPMALPTDVSTTAGALPDVFGALFNDVSFKTTALFGATGTNYAFNYVVGNNYIDGVSGTNTLPYNIKTYGKNVEIVSKQVLALSPELGVIDPFMIDLVSGADLSENLYDHVKINVASNAVTNSAVVNYAAGGTDGDTSWAKFESLVADWLAGDDHGEFRNLQQHPMTHFYDPGFSMSTKTLLFNMLDMRDNFKVDVCTQDISLPINTKAQDISAGQMLLFRAQMHPESQIAGVGCCRVGIYAHAAELVNGSPYGGPIPFNYNRLIQRRDLDGGLYLKGSSGGLPNSQVTIFRKPAWVADDENSQALTWANCINTVRHASRTVIFYPALRTVYPNDTSLLSDDEISDRIIYMFKICRRIWAKYAGVRKDPKKLFPLIQTDINNECAAAFSGDNISIQARVFQTAVDTNLGYQISVNLVVAGRLPMRTMNFNVIVERADG